MNVAVYSRFASLKEIHFLKSLLGVFDKLNWNPIFENTIYQQIQSEMNLAKKYSTFRDSKDFLGGIDFAISVGGDGTFLDTVRYIQNSGVPILGINTGRLGFLADINAEDFESTVERIKKKDFSLQNRSLIRVETENAIFGNFNFAFNEVAIHKKDTASMITVEAYVDGKYLNSYWADGLLVGTPTGSTAYNLSCGGPIITPGSGVFFLTPIAAHNLNVRPIIVPDNVPIKLKAIGRDKNFLISLDANSKTVNTGTEITLFKSDFQIHLIKFEETDFFKTIREKMLWGIDQRNE